MHKRFGSPPFCLDLKKIERMNKYVLEANSMRDHIDTKCRPTTNTTTTNSNNNNSHNSMRFSHFDFKRILAFHLFLLVFPFPLSICKCFLLRIFFAFYLFRLLFILLFDSVRLHTCGCAKSLCLCSCLCVCEKMPQTIFGFQIVLYGLQNG